MSEQKKSTVRVEEAVEYEEVDDIIGIAAELKDAEEDQISVAEVKEIGAELGLDARHIDAAVEERERDREAAVQAEKDALEAAKRRKKTMMVAAAAVAGAVVLFFVIALAGRGGLSATLADVEQKRAQVRSVMDRKAEVEARYEGMSELSKDAEAELAGSLNRVGIERRRYDEAAAAYNADASGFPASLWVGMFGMPDKVPLSSDIEDW